MLLTLRQRFILFICIAVFGFLISSIAGGLILSKFPSSAAAMRIAAVIQSLFQLIIPSILTAVLVTRRPASFLAIDRRIDVPTVFLAVSALIASIPAMNLIIELNQNMSLPESLAGLEKAIREMEDRAADTITLLQGGNSAGDLIMNILIIGVLAGFGEELFFRGTFVRLMTTGNINRHIAVWTVAIVFSALHLQFYGFVPRTLLGAYFGYLLIWSRCLWIPIIVHAANNIIYVCMQWAYNGAEETPVDTIGKNDIWVAIASAAISAVLLTLIYRRGRLIEPSGR